jgi:hypothetical protein
MIRDEFKKVVEEALEKLVVTAEQRLNRTLPRKFCIAGMSGMKIPPDDVTEFLTNWIFVDESHIYPCVDLFLCELLSENRLLFRAFRAGYQPCAYGEHFMYKSPGHDSGLVGPFKIGCSNIVEQLKTS